MSVTWSGEGAAQLNELHGGYLAGREVIRINRLDAHGSTIATQVTSRAEVYYAVTL